MKHIGWGVCAVTLAAPASPGQSSTESLDHYASAHAGESGADTPKGNPRVPEGQLSSGAAVFSAESYGAADRDDHCLKYPKNNRHQLRFGHEMVDYATPTWKYPASLLGERKSFQPNRVILVPGPENEIEVVQQV